MRVYSLQIFQGFVVYVCALHVIHFSNRWREEKVTDQLEQWMMINREKPLWRWGSQAPLAVQFYGKWIELPMEWNFRHFRDIYKVANEIMLPSLLS